MPKNLQKRTTSDLSPLNRDIGVAQTERRLLLCIASRHYVPFRRLFKFPISWT